MLEGRVVVDRSAGEYESQQENKPQEGAPDDSAPPTPRSRQGGGWLHGCSISGLVGEQEHAGSGLKGCRSLGELPKDTLDSELRRLSQVHPRPSGRRPRSEERRGKKE